MHVRILAALAMVSAGAGAAAPVAIKHSSTVLDFAYSWPAEAAAIPALDRRFRAEAARDYSHALPLAKLDHQDYQQERRGSVHDFHEVKWTSAGATPRLLSLQSLASSFTGGAHPNSSMSALLWDKASGRELTPTLLFARPADLGKLTRAGFCKALDRERARRRNGVKMGLVDFDSCPKFSDLSIAPIDTNRNGRFDALQFVASPYTAGPYVEGFYEISVPVTRALIAALKPDYRSSFEAQRQ